jgi:MFS superfamily sulfate permease-like transporter
MAAKHLVKVEELKVVRSASRVEFRIALIALLGVLVFGLLDGLLLAALGSLIVLIARVARPPVVVLARDSAGRFVNRERLSESGDMPGALVLRSGGAWVYFNADYLRRQILELIARAGEPVRLVVIDCSMVPAIDLNAAGSLRALARTLSARGISLHVAELRDDVAESLRVSGAEADLPSILSHQTVESCLAGMTERVG